MEVLSPSGSKFFTLHLKDMSKNIDYGNQIKTHMK